MNDKGETIGVKDSEAFSEDFFNKIVMRLGIAVEINLLKDIKKKA